MIRIVFSTIDKLEHAHRLAGHLVGEKLAACVNIVPEVASVYHWQGTVEQTVENLIMIKTSEDRLEALMSRLKELHTYDLPEIVAVPVETGLPAYLEWVVESTKGSG